MKIRTFSYARRPGACNSHVQDIRFSPMLILLLNVAPCMGYIVCKTCYARVKMDVHSSAFICPILVGRGDPVPHYPFNLTAREVTEHEYGCQNSCRTSIVLYN